MLKTTTLRTESVFSVKRLFYLLFCYALATGSLYAQIKDVKGLVRQERYKEAVEAFEQGDTTNAGSQILYNAGIAYLHGRSYPKALEYLQRAIEADPKVGGKERSYWLGKAYHFNKQYDKAKQLFETYKKDVSKAKVYYSKVDHWITSADYASRLPVSNAVSEYQVHQLDGVSSPFRDHSPIVSEDGNTIYFTRRGNPTGKAKRAPDGKYMEKIMSSTRISGYDWKEATVLDKSVNSEKHNATVTLFDGDQRLMIYQSKRQGDFYISGRKGNSWGKPKPLDKSINSRSYEAHACISRDGNTMIFSSNRKNGDLDLYTSTRKGEDKWSSPKRLGENINTLAGKDAPFLSVDGKTLYFSSRGHNSLGGYDLFRSHWNEGSRSWGKPENLGQPFNSPQDDIYIIWDANEDKGFFASARMGGKGDLDIYEISRIYHIEMKGTVVNVETKEPISGITVSYKDPDTKRPYTSVTDENGQYQVTLPSGNEFPVSLYREASEDGGDSGVLLSDKIAVAQVFQTGEERETNFALEIAPPEPEKRRWELKGMVTSYQEEKPVAGKVHLRNLKTQKPLKTMAVNQEGEFEAVIEGEKGTIIAVDFEDDQGKLFRSVYTVKPTQDSVATIPIVVDYALHPPFDRTEAMTLFDQGKSYRVETLVFDYASAELNEEMKESLDRVIKLEKQFNRVGIRITGHNWGFSIRERDFSQRRVLNVIQYLEKQGVDRSRIRYGYVDQDADFRKRAPSKSVHTPMANMYERRVDVRLAPIPE